MGFGGPFSLVLSGGGLKGLAHVGVLLALEERGLEPELVVGSSMGALIAAAWAAGVPARTLEAGGLLDRTLIVFTSDHGDFLGERGLWYKMHWFEMTARVPQLIHAPKRFAAARVSASVSTCDHRL